MNYIIQNCGSILVFLALLGIEITPIKFNPLTFLGKAVGKLLGIEEIKKEQKALKRQVDKIQKEADMRNTDNIRTRILEFEKGIKKENFLEEHNYKAVFKDIDKWVGYHKKYPELNGMIDVAIENIKDSYKNK